MDDKTFEQLHQEEIKRRPYAVYHPDADDNEALPTFATWKEALAAQKKWNKDCPGHRAFKRR